MSQIENDKKVTVKVKHGYKNCQSNITYTDKKVVGNGTFGVVYQALVCETNEKVAIKKVFQDKRYKNRELQIMKCLQHPNIVSLLYYFLQHNEKDDVYLNLLMEYLPETIYDLIRKYRHQRTVIPVIFIKLFSYQMMRGLSFMHFKQVVHRDIKPTNLLVDTESGVLKLCDFGSAKLLVANQPNVAYICSRFYRAPELILGAVNYSCSIDIWSAGCVIAEMMLGRPIYSGENNIDQLVEIIKILGSPSNSQIKDMNPNYKEFKFPQTSPIALEKVFKESAGTDSINLLNQLFEYSPLLRLTAFESLIHPYFNDLKESSLRLPNGSILPPLYDFSKEELTIKPSLNNLLKQM